MTSVSDSPGASAPQLADPRTTIRESIDGVLVDIFEQVKPDAFDARYLEPSPWSRSYVICFEERSGSTMLCSLLEKTGVLGMPEEFVNPRGPMQMYLQRCDARNLDEYWAYLRHERVTPNGVLGMKTTYPDFRPLIEGGDVRRLLEPVQFIHLTRDDVLRQAVSSALARKRDLWHHYRWQETVVEDLALEEDDRELVLKLVDQLLTERQAWARYFALRDLPVLRITYEDLIADTPATLHRIAGYLGVDIADDAMPTASDTHRLSNDTNETWVRQIREGFAR
jgi:LPS sulfotransferase NodH